MNFKKNNNLGIKLCARPNLFYVNLNYYFYIQIKIIISIMHNSNKINLILALFYSIVFVFQQKIISCLSAVLHFFFIKKQI